MPDLLLKSILQSAGLGHLVGVFAAEDIDGTLLWSLQDSDLRELGLTLGQRRKLLQHLAGHPANPRAPAAAGMPEPELRRLAVLFCDLVGYTELTARTDPDEMRTLLTGYYAAAAAAAQEFGGFVAAQQGDGLVILFGYPITLEGTASRAIGTAHALLARIAGLSLQLPDGQRLGLSARIGIASGRAIVGHADQAPGTDVMMVGPVINRAARLQSVARPGTVVVDATTRSLAAAAFAFADLPDEALKGFDGLVSVSQALDLPAGRPSAAGPAQTLQSQHEAEAAGLRSLWQRAAAGPPLLALITGDAGIGKTTLLDETAAAVMAEGASVLRLACTALHVRDPLQPVKVALARTIGLSDGIGRPALLAALQPILGSATGPEVEAVAEFLGISDPGPAARQSPEERRARLLAGLVHFLAGPGPGRRLVVIEDVHWADPTTRDLLETCARRPSGHGVLMLASSRDQSDPLWSGQDRRVHVPLGRLDLATARRLLDRLLGGLMLPDRVVAEVLNRSDGVPLMLASLARLVEGRADAVLSTGFEVPASIYESIARQLESVPKGRGLAAALSVLDQPSDPAMLAQVMGVSPAGLEEAIAALVASGICVMDDDAGPRLRFSHNLYRAVTYERLVKSTREHLHRAAFAALDHDDSHEPGLLAHHAFEGGDLARAVPLALAAADTASRRSALIEAGQFVQQALTALDRIDASRGHDKLRLKALVAQASLIRARNGIAAPELGVLGRRIEELARAQGETLSEMIALSGLYAHALVGADYTQARSWALRLRDAAEAAQNQTFQMIATRALGVVAFHNGEFGKAEDLLRQALLAYDNSRHLALAYSHGYDHAEVSAAFLSLTLWVSGDLKGAAEIGEFSVEHSRRIGHMHSLAQALTHQALLHALAGNAGAAQGCAQEGMDISARYGLAAMQAINDLLGHLAGLMLQPGPPTAGDLDTLAARNAAFRAVVPEVYQPAIGVLLAGLYLKGNDPGRAEQALQVAATWQDRTGDQFVRAEILRLNARLMALRGEDAAARDALMAAFDAARSMGAWTFALRIACDLVEAGGSAAAHLRLQSARDRLIAGEPKGKDLARCDGLLATGGAC